MEHSVFHRSNFKWLYKEDQKKWVEHSKKRLKLEEEEYRHIKCFKVKIRFLGRKVLKFKSEHSKNCGEKTFQMQ